MAEVISLTIPLPSLADLPMRRYLPHSQTMDEFGINSGYVAELLDRYLHSPESVDEDWRSYFQSRLRRSLFARVDGERQRNNGHARSTRRAAVRDLPSDPRNRDVAGRGARPRVSSSSTRTACAVTSSRTSIRSSRASRAARARARQLRSRRDRPRPHVPDARHAGARDGHAARHHRAPRDDLLPLDRRRVHAHRRARGAPLAARADGVDAEPRSRSTATSSSAS